MLAGWVDAASASTVTVGGLCNDSRRVRPGDLFLAVPGQRTSGTRHLDQAIAAGAVAALVDASLTPPAAASVPLFTVANLRALQGPVAARFYGEPSGALKVIGITGTNGKTSVSHFLAQCLPRCAILGTEGNGFPGQLEPATHTTPDPLALQGWLAQFRDAGAQHVAMEVSSHALHQQRTAGVQFDTAVFTNLGHDHLDYHRDLDDYAAAKANLFASPQLRAAVLNADDPVSERMAAALTPGARVLRYGLRQGDLRGRCQARPGGLLIDLDGDFGQARLASPLLGEFNLYNLLATLGTLLVANVAFADAVERLSTLPSVPGRMQTLRVPGAPLVVVDYAHNPPALESVLTALRAHLPRDGRLWCVFGCGGERDGAKRPVMGELAARLADRVVITDDNPRGESPTAITDAILAGMSTTEGVELIHDRADAITHAIDNADVRDVVLIAGKGAEPHQIVGDQRRPFSDITCAEQALRGRP
ncbi:MAG TPA: UDP-N-acetylmuramoyl-L-alanyl-D-glutamate--2,6-diaminopimelate ligase [Gammaproteobacteria bacterium]|nr:UDP-N-acetylmuramoyl-L-alanyl-D-glutamate--2,6-diaminopimelate ligase [Gammaproteobacteria bacterium]MCH78706.1 UDP-N-acetylmuramoyl-L-alanyl-D-glutamate--2,6-diaminopimelate ligase [Gammaproteobacteria bacterium]